MAQKYLDRIQGLHQLKLEHNEEKLRRMGGSYDLDDHGWIPLDLEHEIEPVRDAESGLVTGMEAVTGTFVRYLDAHPTFMHPDSAFAGCWIGNVSYMNEPWRDSERFWENEEMLPVYNITSRGLYAMNHCAPDLRIGLVVDDVTQLSQGIGFEAFDGSVVKAIVAPGFDRPRKFIDGQ